MAEALVELQQEKSSDLPPWKGVSREKSRGDEDVPVRKRRRPMHRCQTCRLRVFEMHRNGARPDPHIFPSSFVQDELSAKQFGPKCAAAAVASVALSFAIERGLNEVDALELITQEAVINVYRRLKVPGIDASSGKVGNPLFKRALGLFQMPPPRIPDRLSVRVQLSCRVLDAQFAKHPVEYCDTLWTRLCRAMRGGNRVLAHIRNHYCRVFGFREGELVSARPPQPVPESVAYPPRKSKRAAAPPAAAEGRPRAGSAASDGGESVASIASGKEAGGDSGDEGEGGAEGRAASGGGAPAGMDGIAAAGGARRAAAITPALTAADAATTPPPGAMGAGATEGGGGGATAGASTTIPADAPPSTPLLPSDKPVLLPSDKPVSRLERDTALPSDRAKAAMLRRWNELQAEGEEGGGRADMAPGADLPRREVLLAIRGQGAKHWVSFYQVARGMRSHKIHQLFLVSARGDYEEEGASTMGGAVETAEGGEEPKMEEGGEEPETAAREAGGAAGEDG